MQPGEVVAHLNCGDAAFGASAISAGAARVILADRSVVVVQAARAALDVDVRLSHGTHDFPRDITADVVAISLPREKSALSQLLSDALQLLRPGGRCYLAGANNEGARPAARSLEQLFGNAQVVAQGGGGRLVVAVRNADAAPYAAAVSHDDFRQSAAVLRGRPLTLFSRPGVFSWDHLDEATAMLADVMDVRHGESVLDLGCGSGALGTVAALLSAEGRVCMVDADVEAVRSARRTAAHNGAHNAEVHASDVAASVIGDRFDVVVSNPPFHSGRDTDLDLPMRFMQDARTVLEPGGRLYLVANRTLPYEKPLHSIFGNITTLRETGRFKVLSATAPVATRS